MLSIFACSYVLYVFVAVFFMDFLKPLPLLGALSVNGSYIAALVTGARNLAELVGEEFRLINTFSISVTLLISVVPMFFAFVNGSKNRIFVHNNGKLPSKKQRKVYIIDK
jgi:hypothetical protein